MVSLIMALRGLTSNKLRAVLTMLGVIFGVGAVIVAISIAQGAKVALAESIQKLGTNVLTALPGQQKKGNISFGFGTIKTMKLEDGPAILRGCPSIANVSPGVSGQLQVKYENRNTSTSISGTGPDYPQIGNSDLAAGRYFTQDEVKSLRRVAVLGWTTWNDLFDKQSPIGKTIHIAGQPFLIIGLFKEKGGQSFRNPDDAVYVPVTTAMRRLLGLDTIQFLSCQARSDTIMDKAQDELTAVLRKRHKIPTNGTSDFIIFNQADFLATQSQQQDTVAGLTYWMALVSLVVGGIGIMNIMLVSVTERTREIGVRKAIGAKRRNILAQFLLEAIFLSLAGGMIGVIGGIVASGIVGDLNKWKMSTPPESIFLAFGFSAVVGIFFGFYPALKASNLHPIEALRYE